MSQGHAENATRGRISIATTAGEGRSPAGFIGSAALHGAIVAATLFSFTHRLDIADESPPVVPVDLVTLGPKTNVIPTALPRPRIEPKPAPEAPQPPEPKATEPAVPQQETQPVPPPEALSAEPIVKPQPMVPKLKPQQPQDKKNFSVDKVLALLNKVAPSPSAVTNARTGTRNVQGIGAENAMTADLQDSLRSQIQPCWSPPVGAPNPDELVVSFDLFLNPDGSVAQPPQLAADSAGVAARDPFVRAAAEAAKRAIYTCAPFKLPADRYAQWKEINPFIFDPRGMLGQ